MKKNLMILGMSALVIGMSFGAVACSAKTETQAVEEKGSASGESMASAGDMKSIAELKQVPKFKAKSVDGEEVSDEIFKKSKLTIVNIWGSWCKPCVAELPELQKAYEELSQKGVNVMGILNEPDDNAQVIEEIIKDPGVKYTNIYPDGELKGAVLAQQSFPFACIVDSEGKVVKILDEGNTKEYFVGEVEKLLSEMK